MGKYQLKFPIETNLVRESDLEVNVDGSRATLLFSDRGDGSKTVDLLCEVEADNCWEAHEIASNSLVHLILDAISFSTGAPLLAGRCRETLKSEAGQESRKLFFIGENRKFNPTTLTESAISEASSILEKDGPTLPLRWLRYGAHRQYVLDRFVFSWLAFEELAGDLDIQSKCPKCEVVTTRRGANRERAFKMYSSVDREITRPKFNEAIWGRARNGLFHGSRVPDLAALAELHAISDHTRKAAEAEIVSSYGLEQRSRGPLSYDSVYFVYLFIEWKTKRVNDRFAADWPQEVVDQLAGASEIGDVDRLGISGLLTKYGCDLVDVKTAKTW